MMTIYIFILHLIFLKLIPFLKKKKKVLRQEKWKIKDHNLPVKIEGEDRFINNFLTDHRIENRLYFINRNGVITHAKDTIKFSSNKDQTRLIGGLSKCLSFHNSGANLSTKRKKYLYLHNVWIYNVKCSMPNAGLGILQ